MTLVRGQNNRIVLISPYGRKDEVSVGASDIWPGMLVQVGSDGNAIPHSQPGAAGPVSVMTEDVLRGGTILQPALASSGVCPIWRPVKGDKMLFLLQKGQSVTKGTALMSAGDGTLVGNPGEILYEIMAPSTGITNTTTETAFSNGQYTIPANYLQPGDVLVIRGRTTLTSHNGTDTHNIKIYIGSVLIASSGAVNLAANSVVEWALFLTVRTIGATGTIVASGYLMAGVPGTGTPVGVVLSSTTLDTTVAETIKVTSTASAASTSNIIQLDEDTITNTRDTGASGIVVADETKDNSGGTGTSLNNAMFIKGIVV